MDLELFHSEFLNDIHVRLASEGGFTDQAFAEVAGARLEEANEVADLQVCAYRAPSGKMRIDGYAFDEADDSLRVFLVHCADGDQLQTLTQTEARILFRKLNSFVEASFSGSFERSVDENHPARDFAETLRDQKKSLSRIRAYLVTDCVLSAKVRDWPEGEIAGVPVDYHIWDIGRFYRAHMSNTGRDDMVVDFREGDAGAKEGVPCLAATTPGSPYDAYLCVVPASLLAQVYDTYGSRLLEGNVRAFLTAKGKVNQGIRRTLLERPEMFFAYNNGISAVASHVTVENTACGQRLMTATDLQIVNGGQTTASIDNVHRTDNAPRLADTYVPMKLSVVAGERSGTMVEDISRFANSQNKVSDADFFANHPFHQRFEQLSRRILAPARSGMQYETYWYYERARGQYLNEFVKLTPAQRERAKLVQPKQQLITKTDLAKSELSWQGKPNIVSTGAQSFFLEFAKRVDDAWRNDPDAFHEEYFRNAVSRVLIFREALALVSAQPWYYGGYRSIIVAYSIAKLARDISRLSNRELDLSRIWRKQALYPELEKQLLIITEHVFASLSSLPANQINLTQWAKRAGCWEQIQALPSALETNFVSTLANSSEASQERRAAKAMQQVDSGIDYQANVMALGSPYWQAVLDWAQTKEELAPSDLAGLRAAAGFSAAIPTDRQAKRLLQLKKLFENRGFTITLAAPR